MSEKPMRLYPDAHAFNKAEWARWRVPTHDDEVDASYAERIMHREVARERHDGDTRALRRTRPRSTKQLLNAALRGGDRQLDCADMFDLPPELRLLEARHTLPRNGRTYDTRGDE